MDDAELKKRHLQKQRLSSSMHPEISNHHHHHRHHHHRLASMLGRSSSYSRHKASKDLVMNASGSSQVVDENKLKGSNMSFQCFTKDGRNALCPSSSLTTVIRKKRAEGDGLAQRLAHHSCATIEGPSSWFIDSDSDSHSSGKTILLPNFQGMHSEFIFFFNKQMRRVSVLRLTCPPTLSAPRLTKMSWASVLCNRDRRVVLHKPLPMQSLWSKRKTNPNRRVQRPRPRWRAALQPRATRPMMTAIGSIFPEVEIPKCNSWKTSGPELISCFHQMVLIDTCW